MRYTLADSVNMSMLRLVVPEIRPENGTRAL
jgi:hypothetical protein